MNDRLQLLAIIAIVQILIVGFFLMFGGQGKVDEGAWISFESDVVTSIEVADEDEAITVNQTPQGWMIDGLPAEEEKISNLLDKLIGLDAPWPVATTSDAIQRFEVTEENFQRRLVLKNGNEIILDLLLGTSPGYQRVHARRAGDSEVYSVALSNFELPANVDGWLDKALLTVEDEVSQVSLGETVLEKSGEGWLVNAQVANQDVATTYANRFGTMRVLGVYGGDKELTALGTIEINKDIRLEIQREIEEGEYIVRSPKFDRDFRLSTYIAEQLLMTDVDFSVTQAEEAEEAEALDAS